MDILSPRPELMATGSGKTEKSRSFLRILGYIEGRDGQTPWYHSSCIRYHLSAPMDLPQPIKPTEGAMPPTVKVHYKKLDSYSIFHTDGVAGGITPRGLLNLEFFVERQTIPTLMEHDVLPNGLGFGRKVEGLEGLIRLIQCGVILDINTAVNIRDFLTAKIEEYQTFVKSGEGKKT
jgi:hypothetical protein